MMPRTVPDFHAQRSAGQAYFRRWQQLAAEGCKPAVISKAGNPAEWAAWLTYYRAHGLWTQVDLMRDKHDKTVPTLDPADFEPRIAPHWRNDG